MIHAYEDEDNAPMNDDDWWENVADYERRMDEIETANEIKREQKMSAMMDELGVENECLLCPWMKESLEEYENEDIDEPLPYEFADLMNRMCKLCRITPPEDRDEVLTEFFRREDENATDT